MSRRKGGGQVGTEFNRTRAFKGFAYSHEWRGTLVTRAWPVKRGAPQSATTVDQNDNWRALMQSIKTIDPASRLAAVLTADLTAYTYRDVLIMCATGTYVEIEGLPDVSIQDQLDSITTTIGSLLVRTAAGWQGISPGIDGSRLRAFGAGIPPAWADDPIATEDTLGQVIVDGTSITVDLDGMISATAAAVPIASDLVNGKVHGDANTLAIDGSGEISVITANLDPATVASLGTVIPDNVTIVLDGVTPGLISAVQPPIATTATPGLVKPDGTTITVDGSGLISASGGGGGGGTIYPYGTGATATLAGTGFTTWHNQGSATATDIASGILFKAPSNGSTIVTRYLSKAVPAATYVLTALLALQPRQFGQFADVFIGLTDGTKIAYFGLSTRTTGATPLLIINWLNTFNSGLANKYLQPVQASPSLIWLQIERTSTAQYFRYSFDGVNFTEILNFPTGSQFLAATDAIIGSEAFACDIEATFMKLTLV